MVINGLILVRPTQTKTGYFVLSIYFIPIPSLDKWVYNNIVLDIERGWCYGVSPEGYLSGGPKGESRKRHFEETSNNLISRRRDGTRVLFCISGE
jgi:hypothetical protein